MAMRLELRCGCVIAFREDADIVCGTHGRQRVARTLGAPKPRFRGVCTGPYATPEDLSPSIRPLVGKDA